MELSKRSLDESIARQREALVNLLHEPLRRLADACAHVWGDRVALNEVMQQALSYVPYCKFLYALSTDAVQISDNVSHDGLITKDFGRDRAQRPYMNEAVPSTGFLLSQAYISLRAKRPSLTAIQIVRDQRGKTWGFVGADFDLRNLPLTRKLYEEPTYWRQIKGDPAIRGTVFHQTRVESALDQHLTEVLGIVEELVVDHGVFHFKLHFSSSRATIWALDDPYRYRLLDINALTNADTCLAYPSQPYPSTAIVPANKVRPLLNKLVKLRFMDEMLYLRSGSLNLFNGLVSLTFSCDGSHYIPFDEFLKEDHAFWL